MCLSAAIPLSLQVSSAVNLLFLRHALCVRAFRVLIRRLFSSAAAGRFSCKPTSALPPPGVALGLALMMYGREEGAETVIEQMTRDQDPIIRYGGMYTVGLAYRWDPGQAARC